MGETGRIRTEIRLRARVARVRWTFSSRGDGSSPWWFGRPGAPQVSEVVRGGSSGVVRSRARMTALRCFGGGGDGGRRRSGRTSRPLLFSAGAKDADRGLLPASRRQPGPAGCSARTSRQRCVAGVHSRIVSRQRRRASMAQTSR
ncbi:unnamed protein product, partial [Ixodes persulcatus]